MKKPCNRSILILSTAMTTNRRELKERIANIGRRPKVLLWATLIVLAVAAAVCVAACTEGVEQKNYCETLFEQRSAEGGRALVDALKFPEELEAVRPAVSHAGVGESKQLVAAFSVSQSVIDALESGGISDDSLYKNAALIFALTEDIGLVEFNITDGHRASVYQFSRVWADYITGSSANECASSPDALAALLDMPAGDLRGSGYTLTKLENGIEALTLPYPDKEASAAAYDAITQYADSDSAEGTDIAALEECYRLTGAPMPINQTKDYYLYTLDGIPVIQSGAAGRLCSVMPDSYNAIAALFGENTLDTPIDLMAADAPDRTDPEKVAAEFLTLYFDMLCDGSAALWSDPELGGLIAYTTGVNSNEIKLLMQWILYQSMLSEFGGNAEFNIGRLRSLSVDSFERIDTIAPEAGEYRLDGHITTTAASIRTALLFVQNDAGEYQIASVNFPEWEEYHEFRDGFKAYMAEYDYNSYSKTMYIAHIKKQLEASRAELDGWRDGRRICEPFALQNSTIELSYYGAYLDGNGTEQTMSMTEGNAATDSFTRMEEMETLLMAARTVRGTVDKDIDLISYAIGNYDWGAPMENAVEYDPAGFFDGASPVKRLVSMKMLSRPGARERVNTVYYALIDRGGEEAVLMFCFSNAYRRNGGWQLLQDESECERWMKTLRFK